MKAKIIKLNSLKLNKYQNLANGICKEFQKRGFETFWVGGAVRDLLLGKAINDIDLATAAKPDQVKKILKATHLKIYDVGEKFGTVGIVAKGCSIEITTFRSERRYKDFRHPLVVRFLSSAREDARRRDFTVNALYYEPVISEVLDFFGGYDDLQKRLVRFVGKPELRIKEDALRLLRAVRIAAELGFAIAPKDLKEIKKRAALISKIAAERVKAELDKIFSSDNYLLGVEFLDKTGLLQKLFPEVDNLKRVQQSKDYHAEGNAFVHTIKALSAAKDFDRDLRWALFFHDIGKAGTAKKNFKDGREHISFYGHPQKGAEMFLDIARRLRFSAREKKKIFYLIRQHMDLLHPEGVKPNTLVKWAKNEHFGDLIRLRMADSAGSFRSSKSGKILAKGISAYKRLFKEWQKINALQKKNLITGKTVMRILKIKQGPRVGQELAEIKRLQLFGKIKTEAQAEKHLRRKAK